MNSQSTGSPGFAGIVAVVPKVRIETISDAGLTPESAFILSRIEGRAEIGMVAAVTGLPADSLVASLTLLERLGHVELERAAVPGRPTPTPGPARRVAGDIAGAPADAKPDGIQRILPAGDLRSALDLNLSARAGFVLARLDGPMDPEELLAATALPADELRQTLKELASFGLVRLIREDQQDTEGSAKAVAAPRRKSFVRPVADLFGDDAFAGSAAIEPVEWLHHLTVLGRERSNDTIILEFADHQVWAVGFKDGYPMAYRTNRSEESWRVGYLLQQMAGLNDADLEDALAEQAQSGDRLGEVLIRRGVLSEQELRSALTMQARWILRELLLLGPPVRAGLRPGWAWVGDDPKRFNVGEWMLKCARRKVSAMRDRGWARAITDRRWSNLPPTALQMERAALTQREKDEYDRFFPSAGVEINDSPTDEQLILVACGLLEPVAAGASDFEPWMLATAADPMQLLGIHWTALADEVDAAAKERLRQLASLPPATRAALDEDALRSELRLVRTQFDDIEKRRAWIQKAVDKTQREGGAMLLVDQAITELSMRGDMEQATRLAQRILGVAWDIPAAMAAGSYVLWFAARKTGDSREARANQRRLENLLETHKNTAEVFLYGAYYLADSGHADQARTLARKALAINPYLKEARKLAGK